MDTNVLPEDHMQYWLDNAHFHQLHIVTVSALVISTKNVSLPKGVVNGATATVTSINLDTNQNVTSIIVSNHQHQKANDPQTKHLRTCVHIWVKILQKWIFHCACICNDRSKVAKYKYFHKCGCGHLQCVCTRANNCHVVKSNKSNQFKNKRAIITI